MLTPRSRPSGNGSGGGNLFVEADPEQEAINSARTEWLAGTRSAPGARRRRGLVIAVESPSAAVVSSSEARFTRTNGGIGQLSAAACVKLRRADAHAGELLRRLTTRRYAALLAVVLLGVVLISLGWLGLAVRGASAAQHAAERDQIAAAAALRRGQASIDALTGQLDTSEVGARRREQASAAAGATWRARAHTAERKLASARRRRR